MDELSTTENNISGVQEKVFTGVTPYRFLLAATVGVYLHTQKVGENESQPGSVSIKLDKPTKSNHKDRRRLRHFPGGAVEETPRSQCRGSGFNIWSGNWIPHAFHN